MKISGRTLIPIGLFFVGGYFIYRVHDIMLPFVLAATQAYLLSPVIRFFEVRGVRRGPVVILLYVVLVVGLLTGLYYGGTIISSEAQEASVQMPLYVQKAEHYLNAWKQSAAVARDVPWMVRPLILNTHLLESITEHGRSWPQDIVERMPSFASGLLPIFEIGFLVPFIAFFLMREGHTLRETVLHWVPSRYIEMALNILVEIDNSLGKYVRGLCLEAFCVGMLAFIGFSLIHLDYALQIALIVGLANVVPYVGPVVGVILGSGVALFQWGDPSRIVPVLLVCIAVRFIEDWFIQPVVMRHSVHLHPVWIVFSLMAGAKLFGFWGLLFGVPAACMTKVLLKVIWGWYLSQYGLRTSPPLSEVSRIPLI